MSDLAQDHGGPAPRERPQGGAEAREAAGPEERWIADRAYVDAKAEATRAQNDARFAEILARLDRMPSNWSMAGMIAAATATIFGGLLAVLAFGGDRFDGGVQAASASIRQAIEASIEAEDAKKTAEESARRAEENARKMDKIQRDLDTLIELVRGRSGG